MFKSLFRRFKRPRKIKYKPMDYLSQIDLIRSKGLKINSLVVEYDQNEGQYWTIKVKPKTKKEIAKEEKSGD